MNKIALPTEIQTLTRKIIQLADPEKIILFGSYAWGSPGPDSDVDLFIVKETTNTRDTAREIDGGLWGRLIPVDIIVYTPESFKKNLEQGDFFVKKITTKGKILYEKKQ